MTAELDFEIEFHGPFHVGTGTSEGGTDRTVDRLVPLPASSLKGLMRAHVRHVLKVGGELVEQIFGTPGRPSSWAWSDASFVAADTRRAARIQVSRDGSGSVDERFLMIGEHIWTTSATFTVGQLVPMAAEQVSTHLLVLRAGALSVTALGGGRRRGEGWVSISPAGSPWTAAESDQLRRLRGSDQ